MSNRETPAGMTRLVLMRPQAHTYAFRRFGNGPDLYVRFDYELLPAPGADELVTVLDHRAGKEAARFCPSVFQGIQEKLAELRTRRIVFQEMLFVLTGMRIHPVDTTDLACRLAGREFVLEDLRYLNIFSERDEYGHLGNERRRAW